MQLQSAATALCDLARPFAIYAMGSACAAGALIDGVSVDKLSAGGVILSVLVGARTFDNIARTRAERDVAQTQAQTQAQAQAPAPAPAQTESKAQAEGVR